MNSTLDYLMSGRKWLVRDFVVWGDCGLFQADILATEKTASADRVIFMHELVGGSAQVVNFADLYDHRGNHPPSTIDNPQIIIIPKNDVPSFVVGDIGSSSFRIAKSSSFTTQAVVDLLIMEMK